MSNGKETFSFYQKLAKLKAVGYKDSLKKMYKEQGKAVKLNGKKT